MKKYLYFLLILSLLFLYACAQTPEAAPTETPSTEAPTTEAPTTEATQLTTQATTAAPTEPEPTVFVPPDGVVLTAEEVAFYQQLFTKPFDRYADHPKNWYNLLLGIRYATPEEINWNELFWNGVDASGYDITEAELAFLQTTTLPQELDFVRCPVEEMNAIAQQYVGVSIEESAGVGLEQMAYNSSTDCYYRAVSDVAGWSGFTFHSGAVLENGDIRLYYTVGTREWVVTLRSRRTVGAEGYWVISNDHYGDWEYEIQ